MNTVLNDMEALNILVHNLNKVDSKMNAGRFFDARRELMRVIGALEQNKKDLLEYIDQHLEEPVEGPDNEK